MMTNNNLVIREIKKSELSILEDMLYEAIYQPDKNNLTPRSVLYNIPEVNAYIRDFGNEKDDYCLVAELDGNIIGAVWIRIISGSMKGYGYVDDYTPEFAISIFEEYRNQGIGTKLMRTMINHLRKRGYKQVSLSVKKENYAVKLYQKVGFEVVEEKDDDYLMILKFNKLSFRPALSNGFEYAYSISEYKDEDILLKPLRTKDIPFFEQWLNKEYIYKWLCPDGEENRKAWLDEIAYRDSKYDFIKHFIVFHGNHKIGYCFYADCYFLKDSDEEENSLVSFLGDVAEVNHTYEIGYLIGEEKYLNKGISKIIIRKLEGIIRKLGGKEIFADPSEKNLFSIKALLSNGFKKRGEEDYRKVISHAGK